MEWSETLVQLVQTTISWIIHLDVHLNQGIAQFGDGMYVILFLIIFAETGLVVAPFLPGDSLLFAVGALCAVDQPALKLPILAVTLTAAGILGDAVNYTIGSRVGPRIFSQPKSRWFNPEHLRRTHEFYEKHGGRAIILARFLPIFRTFAPFVAGIAKMTYKNFAAYNVVGGILWVQSFLFAGYGFGNVPAVKTNFHLVILAIITLSTTPVVFEYWKMFRAKSSSKNS
ncbi:MAG: DedA family protein [Bdellovibrionales bacterium]|nr:DedA family protein [Bdellovibrionales bacterium]